MWRFVARCGFFPLGNLSPSPRLESSGGTQPAAWGTGIEGVGVAKAKREGAGPPQAVAEGARRLVRHEISMPPAEKASFVSGGEHVRDSKTAGPLRGLPTWLGCEF